MRRFIKVFGIAYLIAFFMPAPGRAGEVTVFPPDTITGTVCPKGAKQLLMWDGKNQVRCVTIPTCKPYIGGGSGPYPFTTYQLLEFDYSTFTFTCQDPHS